MNLIETNKLLAILREMWPNHPWAENAAVAMMHEGAEGLSAEKVVNATYALLCDHPRMTPEALDDLANRLGRAAHEMARSKA